MKIKELDLMNDIFRKIREYTNRKTSPRDKKRSKSNKRNMSTERGRAKETVWGGNRECTDVYEISISLSNGAFRQSKREA